MTLEEEYAVIKVWVVQVRLKAVLGFRAPNFWGYFNTEGDNGLGGWWLEWGGTDCEVCGRYRSVQ